MIVQGMRWGYDGGDIPRFDGSTIVEIMVIDENKHIHFVLDSKFSDDEIIRISEVPIFDLEMCLGEGIDLPYELEKIKKLLVEEYEFDSYYPPEELQNSRFAKVIHLVRLAMEKYYGHNEEYDYLDAQEFISEYLYTELETIELPVLESERAVEKVIPFITTI